MIKTVPLEFIKQGATDEMEFGEEIGAGLLPLDHLFTRERMSEVSNFVTREAFVYYIAYNRARLRHSIYTYADMIGISISELAKIENDVWHEPSYEVWDKLARFLNVDHRKLIDLPGIEKPKCESFTKEHCHRSKKCLKVLQGLWGKNVVVFRLSLFK